MMETMNEPTMTDGRYRKFMCDHTHIDFDGNPVETTCIGNPAIMLENQIDVLRGKVVDVEEKEDGGWEANYFPTAGSGNSEAKRIIVTHFVEDEDSMTDEERIAWGTSVENIFSKMLTTYSVKVNPEWDRLPDSWKEESKELLEAAESNPTPFAKVAEFVLDAGVVNVKLNEETGAISGYAASELTNYTFTPDN